jgi:hypothetical protein
MDAYLEHDLLGRTTAGLRAQLIPLSRDWRDWKERSWPCLGFQAAKGDEARPAMFCNRAAPS